MIVGQIQKGEKMGRTLNEDDVLKEIDRWIGYLDEDMITRIKIGIKKLQSVQPEQRWIPCTDPTKLPKNKVLWITCDICGCRVLKEIYWDMTEWSEDVSGLIAYMPYVAPEPYREEGE